MGIGASIFLIALGAILAFAVNVDLGGIDINVIGWILMLAGALGLITFALIWRRRRTVVAATPVEEREVVTRDPMGYRRVEERRDVDPRSDPSSAQVGYRRRAVCAAPPAWKRCSPTARG